MLVVTVVDIDRHLDAESGYNLEVGDGHYYPRPRTDTEAVDERYCRSMSAIGCSLMRSTGLTTDYDFFHFPVCPNLKLIDYLRLPRANLHVTIIFIVSLFTFSCHACGYTALHTGNAPIQCKFCPTLGTLSGNQTLNRGSIR